MAAECLQLHQKREPLQALAQKYFTEMTETDIPETRKLHPAKEQTEFVFREIDNRWKQFCYKTNLGFDTDAFMAWANGEPFSLLGGRP
jgi:hypothetical protein